jgi:hypothetical protein
MGFLQKWRGLKRYRCRECRRIFYSQMSPAEAANRAKQKPRMSARRPAASGGLNRWRLGRRAMEFILFLCLVAIFYAALKYLARVP